MTRLAARADKVGQDNLGSRTPPNVLGQGQRDQASPQLKDLILTLPAVPPGQDSRPSPPENPAIELRSVPNQETRHVSSALLSLSRGPSGMGQEPTARQVFSAKFS